MNTQILKSILFGFSILCLLLTSCTKENSVTINETEEPIEESALFLTVNNNTITTNAFAAYCQNDTSEFLVVANKVEFLSWPTAPISTADFEDGDFIYASSTTDNTAWGWGTQALGPDASGIPDLDLSILGSDAVITINSNDGEVVSGSSTGTLMGVDLQGNFYDIPYSFDFSADIVQVSEFCN